MPARRARAGANQGGHGRSRVVMISAIELGRCRGCDFNRRGPLSPQALGLDGGVEHARWRRSRARQRLHPSTMAQTFSTSRSLASARPATSRSGWHRSLGGRARASASHRMRRISFSHRSGVVARGLRAIAQPRATAGLDRQAVVRSALRRMEMHAWGGCARTRTFNSGTADANSAPTFPRGSVWPNEAPDWRANAGGIQQATSSATINRRPAVMRSETSAIPFGDGCGRAPR